MHNLEIIAFNDTQIVDVTIRMCSAPPSIVIQANTVNDDVIVATFPSVYYFEGRVLGVLALRELIDGIVEDKVAPKKMALQSAVPSSAKEYRVSLTGGSEVIIVSEPIIITTK